MSKNGNTKGRKGDANTPKAIVPEVAYEPDLSDPWYNQILPRLIPGLPYLKKPEFKPSATSAAPALIMQREEEINALFDAWVRTWKKPEEAQP